MKSSIQGAPVALAIVLLATTLYGHWTVTNDEDDDVTLIIAPANGGSRSYHFKTGQTLMVAVGRNPHAIRTVIAGHGIDHDERYLGDRDVTTISQIRTPVGTAPNGRTIYMAMPRFPHAIKYERLLRDLRRSTWKGTFSGRGGNQRGSLRLRGQVGDADYGHSSSPRGTTLSEVKYVPGDSYFITGRWDHVGSTGTFTLRVAPTNPWYSEGYYRFRGQSWNGEATRPVPINVVVIANTAEIKSAKGEVLRTVNSGDRLIIHRVTEHWCWVSLPGQKPLGWIQPKYVRQQ